MFSKKRFNKLAFKTPVMQTQDDFAESALEEKNNEDKIIQSSEDEQSQADTQATDTKKDSELSGIELVRKKLEDLKKGLFAKVDQEDTKKSKLILTSKHKKTATEKMLANQSKINTGSNIKIKTK